MASEAVGENRKFNRTRRRSAGVNRPVIAVIDSTPAVVFQPHQFLSIERILLISSCWAGSLWAQIAQNRNSIRLGIDLTSLDALGYMTKSTPNRLFHEVDPGNNQRKRITADLMVFFDLIPSSRHALRIGPGLSAWYRQDDTFRGATIVSTPSIPPIVVIDRRKQHELNLGSHIAAEYDWLFHPNWSADVRLRLASIRQAGISSMFGAGVNYHF